MSNINISNIMKGARLIRMLRLDPDSRLGPIRVDIAVTSGCNYHCVFCGTHSYLLKQQPQADTLKTSTLVDLLADLKRLGTTEILFAGNGEPLLSESLIKIIQNTPGFRFEIMTNGSLLDKVDWITFDNLHRLIISLNSGNGQSHQKTHGYKGDNQFPHIIENIQRLLGYPGGNRKIELNYVITNDNRNELVDFRKLASEWRVKTHIRPVDSNTFNELALPGSQSDNELYPCYIPFIQPSITAKGDVFQSCWAATDLIAGNIYQKPFKELWKAGRQSRFKAKTMSTPLAPNCPGCVNAKVVYKKLPRWLGF